MADGSSDRLKRGGWLGWFPELDRDGRVELKERVEIGAHADVDFIMMMVLSVSLASLGLMQGSTAVIIGAMLVAPLMGPLVGAGLGLAQANPTLFRRSLGATGVGLVLGIAASLLLGFMNPGFEVSLEIESRGRPDLFDLGIAFVSGLAAAYAQGRPNVSGTLAGVAIAAALVPPLAVVGIAFTNGYPAIAGNAAILVLTNVVAIVLGAGLIFRLLGVASARAEQETPPWVRRMAMGLSLLAVILAAPLVLQMVEKQRVGQSRPLTYPVSAHTRLAIKDFVQDYAGIQVVMAARNSVEPEAGVMVISAASDRILPDGFESGLTEAVRQSRGDEVPVQIFVLHAASTRAVEQRFEAGRQPGTPREDGPDR